MGRKGMCIMRGCVRLAALVWGVAPALLADPIEDVQAATVYIKMLQRGTLIGSGSGFIVQADGDGTYVVTNRHVAAPEDLGNGLKLVAVLRSGTPQEESQPLELLGLDPVNDLALLRSLPFAAPPRPLRLPDGVEPAVGEELSVVGFPFGKGLVLDDRKENPVVSVSRVAVQRPYRAQFGVQRMIWTVGNANHGNSGGPVVDSRGRLAGVLVAGLHEVRHGIGIIPIEHVRDLWAGNCQPGGLALVSRYGIKLRARFRVHLCDPFATVQSARLVVLPAEKVTPTMGREEFHRLAAEHFRQDVELPPARPSALDCVVVLPIPDAKERQFAYAVQVTRRDGTNWLSLPEYFTYTGSAARTSLVLDLAAASPYLRGETPGLAETGPDDWALEAARREGKVGRSSLAALQTADDMRVTHVDCGLLPSAAPLWEGDGGTVLVADSGGWLVRMALPSFERIGACRLQDGAFARLGPGAQPVRLGTTRVVSLARSRHHVLVLSHVAYPSAQASHEAWVQVLDPASLATRAFFAVPGVAGISALPDSDRVLVRYFTGELGLLDPEGQTVSAICRPRRAAGLPVAGSADVPVLPTELLLDACLAASGSRLLVQTESGVFLLELTPEGRLAPFGPGMASWPGMASIRCQPGTGVALLVPSYRGKTPPPRPQAVDLGSCRATALLPGDWQCVDARAERVVRMETQGQDCVLLRQGLGADASCTKSVWPERRRSPAAGPAVDPATALVVAHPRGNAYWVQYAGKICWAEFGPAWVAKPESSPAAGAADGGGRTPPPARSPAEQGVTLGKNADMTVRALRLSDRDGAGLCWTEDGKAFLAAWNSGILRRVGLADLVVEKQADLGNPCRGLGRSALGPVAILETDGAVRLVVLDEKSLRLGRGVTLPADSRIALATAAPIALAAVPGKGLAVVDLARERVVHAFRAVPNAGGDGKVGLGAIDAVALSADGQRAYVAAEGNVLSLRLEKDKLRLERMLPHTPQARAVGLALSSDDLYLDVETSAGAQSVRHVVRLASRPEEALLELRTAQVVFDCGGRRLLWRPSLASSHYPFVGPVAVADQQLGDRPVRFVAGRHVLAHPAGNLLVTLGEELHVLEYSWGYVR